MGLATYVQVRRRDILEGDLTQFIFLFPLRIIIDATNQTMNAKKIPIKKDEVPVFLKKVSRGGRTTWWMPPLENFLMHHFLSFSREHVSTSDAVVHITPRPSSNSIEVDCHYSHP